MAAICGHVWLSCYSIYNYFQSPIHLLPPTVPYFPHQCYKLLEQKFSNRSQFYSDPATLSLLVPLNSYRSPCPLLFLGYCDSLAIPPASSTILSTTTLPRRLFTNVSIFQHRCYSPYRSLHHSLTPRSLRQVFFVHISSSRPLQNPIFSLSILDCYIHFHILSPSNWYLQFATFTSISI